MIGKTIRSFLPKEHLLSYLEAILRVYNMLGRRDNLYKARIKILVNSVGQEEFTRLVEDEWQLLKDGPLELPAEEITRINAYFAPPDYETLDGPDADILLKQSEVPDFGHWVSANVADHKVPGYAIANISLKPIGGIPGDITADQMDVVADLAEQYSLNEIRATHEQNLVLPHVKHADLFDLWQALTKADLATANLGLISDMISCPGLDYCDLANARSIPVAQRISERFEDLQRQHDIGDLKLKISGCINACGHHHVGNIGILGVDKKGTEFYQITLGGSATEDTTIGKIVGPAFSYDDVVDAVETIVSVYLNVREDGEVFNDTVARLGVAPFKEKLYGSH